MFYNGQGVAQDYAEAVRLYSLAAAQGHAVAQFNLGYMFEKGQGVAQDRAEAIRWYRLAAAQGDAGATAALKRLGV
jgi:TPR repeat protein